MRDIIVGKIYRKKLESSLICHGFNPLWLDKNPELDIRLAYHTDLSVFTYGKTAVISPYLFGNDIVKFLTNRGYEIKISKLAQSGKYPHDINLCAAVVGENILHNNRYTDPLLLEFGLSLINIKQGYARCSVLTVDNNSIITADKGIALTARNAGIDVLEITSAGIELEGFNEGFIGGASFVAENEIYFIGDIETHPSASLIVEFISKRGKRIVCLDKGPLTDIGGAIYIK